MCVVLGGTLACAPAPSARACATPASGEAEGAAAPTAEPAFSDWSMVRCAGVALLQVRAGREVAPGGEATADVRLTSLGHDPLTVRFTIELWSEDGARTLARDETGPVQIAPRAVHRRTLSLRVPQEVRPGEVHYLLVGTDLPVQTGREREFLRSVERVRVVPPEPPAGPASGSGAPPARIAPVRAQR